MSLEPGEIYFVRESLKNSPSGRSKYVKIGLVSKNRSSFERLREHQTGNPRKLLLESMDLIKTDLVSRVESQLHRRFAAKRVHGEWFEFETEEELTSAIAEARKLAVEAGVASKLFKKALELDKSESTSEKRAQNESDVTIARRHQLASMVLSEIKDLRELLLKQFASAKDAGVDVSGTFSEKSVSLKPVFNVEDFLAKYPKLFEEFVEVLESKTWAHRFSVSFKLAEVDTLADVYPDLASELIALRSVILSAKGEKTPFLLAEVDSTLLRLEGYWSWEKEMAKAELQIATGAYAGIADTCSWNRQWKTSTKRVLDESALLKSRPKIYSEFIAMPVERKRRTITKSKVS